MLAWLAADTVRPLAYVGVFIFVIAGFLVSLCLHEFAHAYTAYRFGDHDAEARGYLTLNPLKYTHPLLSLGLPALFIALGGIGLPGGAVYLRTSWMTKRQKTLVSLAGPATNLAFAIVLLALTSLLREPSHAVFWAGMAFQAFLQVTAFLINILPVPGLDGYSALEPHLSPQTQRAVATGKAVGVPDPAAAPLHTTGQPLVLRHCGLVLRAIRDLHRAVADRQPAHPVLVRLVLTAILRHMRLYA